MIVPGSDNDATHHDAARGPGTGPAGMARALAAATAGSGTAVVAWTGYTTPVGVGLDAAGGRLADAGAVRLARFTAGWTRSAPPTRRCCSATANGSVVCGLAARHTDAADIVVCGSPGMRAASAAALRTGARVWAARGPSDWIADVPNVELAGLGHGADPRPPRSVPAGCPPPTRRATPVTSRPAPSPWRPSPRIATGTCDERPDRAAGHGCPDRPADPRPPG
ncbi:alpha/beta hydrolase, partial [Streptomyces cirratus]